MQNRETQSVALERQAQLNRMLQRNGYESKRNQADLAGPRNLSHGDAGRQGDIIDPWVMGNPACPAAEKQIKKVDVMLCTHGHFDHIGDAVEIAKGFNPTVVGIPNCCTGWKRRA